MAPPLFVVQLGADLVHVKVRDGRVSLYHADERRDVLSRRPWMTLDQADQLAQALRLAADWVRGHAGEGAA